MEKWKPDQKSSGASNSFTCHGRPCLFSMSMKGSGSICSMLNTPSPDQVPVTIIEAGPCYVSQVKTDETDGYNAVQLGFDDVKPRNSTMPLIGHDAKSGVSPKRVHREVRLSAEEVAGFTAGQQVTVEAFASGKAVITATDSGGPTELLEDRRNGLVVAPEPAALAVAIARVMEDPGLAERLGGAGLADAARMTWAGVVEKLVRLPR